MKWHLGKVNPHIPGCDLNRSLKRAVLRLIWKSAAMPRGAAGSAWHHDHGLGPQGVDGEFDRFRLGLKYLHRLLQKKRNARLIPKSRAKF